MEVTHGLRRVRIKAFSLGQAMHGPQPRAGLSLGQAMHGPQPRAVHGLRRMD